MNGNYRIGTALLKQLATLVAAFVPVVAERHLDVGGWNPNSRVASPPAWSNDQVCQAVCIVSGMVKRVTESWYEYRDMIRLKRGQPMTFSSLIFSTGWSSIPS
jgi:hypothetical protein